MSFNALTNYHDAEAIAARQAQEHLRAGAAVISLADHADQQKLIALYRIPQSEPQAAKTLLEDLRYRQSVLVSFGYSADEASL